MRDFINALREEVDQKIRVIETGDDDILRRCDAASAVFEDAFGRLKSHIVQYGFADRHEEIEFFKEIKPRFFSKLLYYSKVYRIEIDRPMGSIEAQSDYLVRELDQISDYINKRLDFYRYYRSGNTHFDADYFLRSNRGRTSLYQDSFYFERDPVFSTPCDFTVAKILSYDMLQVYLRDELNRLGENRFYMSDTPHLPVDIPRWTDTKSGLVALIYALHTLGSFDNGRVSLRRLQEFFETYFGIRLGNIARAFAELRMRSNPSHYFDKLKDAFLRRVEDTDKGNYHYHMNLDNNNKQRS